MEHMPIFTGLQDNEVCTVSCKDNNVSCLLDPSMDPLIFPVQEEKCLGILNVVTAQVKSFVNVVQGTQELARSLARHMR